MRRFELAANLLIVFGPLAIGMLMLALLSPSLTIPASLACYGIGLALLVYAKGDLFQRGILFSFGPSRMTAASRNAYRQAYGFILVGAALNLISLLTLRNFG